MTAAFRRYLSAAVAVAIALLTMSSNARLAASPGQPPTAQTMAEDIAPEALAQIEALIREKDFRSEGQRKIDSQLIAESRMERGQPIAAGVLVTATDLPYAADGHVVADVTARVTDELLAGLATLGIEVLSSDAEGGTMRVHLDIDQVEALAALPDVSFVQPQQQAQIHQAAPNVVFTQTGQGSRSSQGDITHLAYAARAAFGATGSGIKIGVLSDGVTNLATSQASGDLGPVTVLPGQTGSGDEGTAMLEIIHDLAPGAQLYFATAFTSITSFANNIRALRAAGCDIIVDDVAYFAETAFQDGQAANVVSNTNGGVVIQAVNDVTADGALYFSSAGNSGHLSAGTSGTWEGDFVDGGPAPALGGLTSGNLHRFGSQNFTAIVTPAASAPTNLSWSDPLGGSANDYDLFRLNSTGTAVVASSTNIQSGTQDPYEQLSTPGAAGERIVIVKKNTAAIRFLHLGTNRGVLSIATVGETHGHPAAAAAFDVAATPAVGPFPQPFNATNVVETFSSDGPRRVFFAANGSPYTAGNSSSTGGVLRQKPDITAADGVSVTGAGGFPSSFFGTSAAAPHAAAIAGLLKSANRTLTPAQIRTLLTASAIDIGAAGVDRDSGAGIVMADAVMRAAGVPGTALVELVSAPATDDPGNGNGAPEAGEGVRLVIPLANYGGAPATAVVATLTSTTPGITITQPATRTYPDLAVSASATAPPYFFTVASDFPCLQPASFTLTVTSAAGPRVFSFQVPIGPPAFSITTTLDTAAPRSSPGVTTAAGLQTPRLTRNGVASSCGASKVAPPLFGTDASQFHAYAFATCSTSVTSCVTVTLQGANAANLFSASYSPTFAPDNVQQNYTADAGSSGSSQTYGFTLPAGAQTFVVDVHEVAPGLGIGTPYTLSVAGVCGGTCVVNHVPLAIARDVTVPADVSGTADASVDNGSSDADGDPLTITQSPAGPYPIGQTTVLLTVRDPHGATSQATAVVTVVSTTRTVVAASPNPSFTAQPVAFTATVTTSAGEAVTDGTVTFRDGSTLLGGPTAVSGGRASVATSSLSAGAHTITASYASASNGILASSGSIVQQVVNTPAISIADTSVVEGNSGTTNAQFHVTLSNVSPAAVTVHYATGDETAAAPDDYTAASGSVTFAPGELEHIVTVVVIGDTILNGTRTFVVNLTTPVNGTVIRAQAIGTIVDDDAVTEARIAQGISAGAARLQTLQRTDGGWFFMVGDTDCSVGPGVSCRNTVGNTALGLLAGYTRTGNPSLLNAAKAAGDDLLALYVAALSQSPPARPFAQDIEFLAALGQLTGNALYTLAAQSWFQVVVNQFPNAADNIDRMIASRDSQHLRSLAAWDAASFIRAAKAAGHVDYALAAASRIRAREVDWKDTNPAHRFDQCANPNGCGPADNRLAFDYTIAGEGSLLWAIHDLPGFDDTIAEYRSFLLAQQDRSGSWDVGDSQMSAYVVLGLAAVGGPGSSSAMMSAAAFFLGNQFPSGGWPASVFGGDTEYTVIDAEIARAIATLFNTPAGSNVSVAPAQLSTVTFGTVSTSGLTSVVALDHSAAVPVPSGFEIIHGLDYTVLTTASVAGDTVACFVVSWISDAATFGDVRVLHEEQGALVDRTILAPGQAGPDFASRQVCARVSGLTTFALALRASVPDAPAPAVNHAPTADAQALTTAEDTPAAIALSALDPDGDTVSYRILTDPAHGTLSGIPPALVYTPAANYNGTDLFTFAASDGSVTSAPATVSLTITPVNDAPIATAQALTTAEKTATRITLSATDVDGDALTFRIVTRPAHGTLSGTAPNLTYTPADDYKGTDRFTFTANDGKAESAAAAVSLTITEAKSLNSGPGSGSDGAQGRRKSGGGE